MNLQLPVPPSQPERLHQDELQEAKLWTSCLVTTFFPGGLLNVGGRIKTGHFFD
jgi:hypothetical protein